MGALYRRCHLTCLTTVLVVVSVYYGMPSCTAYSVSSDSGSLSRAIGDVIPTCTTEALYRRCHLKTVLVVVSVYYGMPSCTAYSGSSDSESPSRAIGDVLPTCTMEALYKRCHLTTVQLVVSVYYGIPICTAYFGSIVSGSQSQTLVSDGCYSDSSLVGDDFDNIKVAPYH